MDSDAEQLGGIAATYQRWLLFFPENLQSLGLQTNAPETLVYLGLVHIYFRVGEGGPWGHLMWIQWRVMKFSLESLSA